MQILIRPNGHLKSQCVWNSYAWVERSLTCAQFLVSSGLSSGGVLSSYETSWRRSTIKVVALPALCVGVRVQSMDFDASADFHSGTWNASFWTCVIQAVLVKRYYSDSCSSICSVACRNCVWLCKWSHQGCWCPDIFMSYDLDLDRSKCSTPDTWLS